MSGGGTLGGVGPTPESVPGTERSKPAHPAGDEFITQQDLSGPVKLTSDQINITSLLGIRASLLAALQQVETALLLNGVTLRKSPPSTVKPRQPEGSPETLPTFGAKKSPEASKEE